MAWRVVYTALEKSFGVKYLRTPSWRIFFKRFRFLTKDMTLFSMNLPLVLKM
nr:hypothetical protein [uncultured bacterium]